jgi:RimJ/RimL family protein N-acetyltransferase
MGDSEAPRASDELVTERLLLRRWRPADDPVIAAITADPEVRRYLTNAKGPFVERFERHWREHGFGWWALQRRDRDGPIIGFVGLAHPHFLTAVAHRVEIGWRLAAAEWGQGFATEAAVAARDHAAGTLGITNLIAVIHPQNARSRRVAGKLGMAVDHHVHHEALGIAVEIWAQNGRRAVP